MPPLISIIIPVYNRVEILRQSLASVYDQTYPNLEVIIVDDGSKEPILDSDLPQKDDVPLSIVRQENKGAPNARNRGFGLAKGEYVIFWDADVVGEPEMIQMMYETLIAHAEADYAYSNFYFGKRSMPARPFDAGALRKTNYITTTSLLRRGVFPGFDETLQKFQDWDLWLTLLDQKKIGVYVPSWLFRAIPHERGISQWLPSWAYRFPWKYLPVIKPRARNYESAKAVVIKKHGLFG